MIQVQQVPGNSKFPFKVYVEVDWPLIIHHNGTELWKTRKEGTKLHDNTPCAEYTDSDDNRFWLDINGNIEPE